MNLVEQIYDGIRGVITSNLSSYSELAYVHELSENSFAKGGKFYGVRPLAASQSPTSILKHYTVDQDFEIILMSDFVNTHGTDEDLRSVINSLYADIDTVFVNSVSSKVGIPNIVLVVGEYSIQEPEILEDNNVVALRATISVKYRNTLNL